MLLLQFIHFLDGKVCLEFGVVDPLIINFGVVNPLFIHKMVDNTKSQVCIKSSVVNHFLGKNRLTLPNLSQT